MGINDKSSTLFLTTFPPRECGIATFCQDLFNALIAQFDDNYAFEVCALHEGIHHPDFYPKEVTHVLNTEDVNAYMQLAQTINANDRITNIVVQHEFGLFGGEYGQDLLTFLFSVEKPVSIVFHTVLPGPNPVLKKVVNGIADLVDSIIVMTQTSSKILGRDYEIDATKISVIPHGTHPVSWGDQVALKKKYGLEDKTVLSTFGLISANKSIETALKALPKIVQEFPKAIYLVLGKTHPKVIENEGERYRSSLEELVKELDIKDHVIFVNEYLSLTVLLDYLKLSDLYLFTSKDPNQAVSGTFAYALSCACPVISTPIPHAKEVLEDNTGMLFDFFDHDDLANQTIHLLKDSRLLNEKSLNAYHKSQITIWPNVSISYMQQLLKTSKPMADIQYKRPEINFGHLKRLTTDRGVIQFSKISIPDLDSGYTIDDNARALVASIMQYEVAPSDELLVCIETYLDFIAYCQQTDGRFMNYVDVNGMFHTQNHYVNLEDSNARAIWSLGYLLGNCRELPQDMIAKANNCFQNTIPNLALVNSPRSIAFIIKGLYDAYQYRPLSIYKALITELANKLVSQYESAAEDSWDWFEDYLTYANGVMPEALILAYDLTQETIYRDVALNSLNFLLSQTFTKDQIKVISNRGWQHKGQKKEHHFGEQPIDVTYTILALSSFYNVLGIERYKDYMEVAYSWFLGNNHLKQIMYDPLSGGGYDGLEETNPNLNQGAESTVCFLLASMILRKYATKQHIELVDDMLVAPISKKLLKV